MSAEIWSPLEIETMLMAYYRGDGVLCEPTQDSPAHLAARSRLWLHGLVEKRDEGEGEALFATDMGKAFVSLILQTPIPVVRYVDPRTERAALAVAVGGDGTEEG